MRLLDYCEINAKKVEPFEGEKFYIATGDVINNKINLNTKVSYNKRPSRANVSIEENDLLFAKMKDTIKVIRGTKENINYIYSTGFFCITPKSTILPKFLEYYLNSFEFNTQKNRLSSGSTMKGLNNKGLEQIEVNFPNIEKQKEIVNKIDNIVKMINIKQNNINDYNELLKIKFIDLFGFNREDKYPKEKLNDVCIKITDGKHGGCSFEDNSGYYFVGATEIHDNIIDYEHAKQISYYDFIKDYNRCDLKKGDFLIVNTGATIGKSAIANLTKTDNILLQKSVALIRTNTNKLLPEYLQYLYMCNPELYNKGQGCARINLLIGQIKDTLIILPPIDEQMKFKRIYDEINKLINEEKKTIELLEELFFTQLKESYRC